MNSLKTWVPLALLTLAAACGIDDSTAARHDLGSAGTVDPDQTAAGENNTFNHVHDSTGGENGITDVPLRHTEEQTIGTPEEVAKLHGAQKISYAALGTMLADFGVSLAASKANPQTAGQLYTTGKNALGAPVYGSRTPEMMVPSTSALAKEFDIFVAAAPDIVAKIGQSKRCPGVVLVQNNQLTEDGISCLIGKPATAAHLTLANQLIADSGDPTKGIQIAVATLLAAAHISE